MHYKCALSDISPTVSSPRQGQDDLLIRLEKLRDGRERGQQRVSGVLQGPMNWSTRVAGESTLLRPHVESALEEAFTFFARDGAIGAREMCDVFRAGGCEVNEAEALSVIKSVKNNEDLRLNFDEFKILPIFQALREGKEEPPTSSMSSPSSPILLQRSPCQGTRHLLSRSPAEQTQRSAACEAVDTAGVGLGACSATVQAPSPRLPSSTGAAASPQVPLPMSSHEHVALPKPRLPSARRSARAVTSSTVVPLPPPHAPPTPALRRRRPSAADAAVFPSASPDAAPAVSQSAPLQRRLKTTQPVVRVEKDPCLVRSYVR